jgi:hypothetical protein
LGCFGCQHILITTFEGDGNMLTVFESDRIYDDYDQELDLIAGRPRRAQWRHRNVGPAYLKLGRRVKYHGADLNKWIAANRVETCELGGP